MLPSELLSGSALEQFVTQYLESLDPSLHLKETIRVGTICAVHVWRCKPLDTLIEHLEDKAHVGSLQTQHDILKIFLKKFRFGDKDVLLEVPTDSGLRLDLKWENHTYELKTMQNLPWQHLDPFITQYFLQIWTEKALKHTWELAFFEKRQEPKDKNRQICLYYLVVIEVNAQSDLVKPKNKAKVVKEAQSLVNQAVKQVQEEDEIEDEGILFPVKNILIVDKLRESKKQLQEDKKQLQEDKKQLQEDKKQLQLKVEEQSKQLNEKDKENVELKKRLAKFESPK